MAKRNCFFALDIGTHCDDLTTRLNTTKQIISAIEDTNIQKNIKDFLYFSTGIWPAAEAISERENQLIELEKNIVSNENICDFGKNKLCALGECGLDHHWNPNGPDNRKEDDFSDSILHGEAELFEAQLEMARKYKLPVIVHSRDAFDGTISCISNVGYDNGIIHCYSYGKDEAKRFLDRGWYISFSGSITYTKPSKQSTMTELLEYIPRDRMLLETDSPYLAPVPHRGKINNPELVEFVYKYVSNILNITLPELSSLIDSNIRTLFNLT